MNALTLSIPAVRAQWSVPAGMMYCRAASWPVRLPASPTPSNPVQSLPYPRPSRRATAIAPRTSSMAARRRADTIRCVAS
ncbi:hypothetical protein EJ03DRAFT_322802 [Teratosphaeria nubilosa]|uniref:Uncharacterized protein n=1 Tax=Teratosphaeria nubilosa TaxID=161662 RepID=A0A6G1LMP6_9PEZI|nr:hypothetical protein EJ03DRAFT_322802 [Teratosphaeria nubilosa]